MTTSRPTTRPSWPSVTRFPALAKTACGRVATWSSVTICRGETGGRECLFGAPKPDCSANFFSAGASDPP
jgi:hypothetical protein